MDNKKKPARPRPALYVCVHSTDRTERQRDREREKERESRRRTERVAINLHLASRDALLGLAGPKIVAS